MDKNEYKRLRLTLEAAFGQKKEVLTAYKKATSVTYEGVKEDEFKKELDKYADEFLKSIDEIIFGKKILKGMRKVDATSIKKSIDDLTNEIENYKEKYLWDIKGYDSSVTAVERLRAELDLKKSEDLALEKNLPEIKKEMEEKRKAFDNRYKKSKELFKESEEKYHNMCSEIRKYRAEIRFLEKEISEHEEYIKKLEGRLPELKKEAKEKIEEDGEISKLKRERHRLIRYLKNGDGLFDFKGRKEKKASVLAAMRKHKDEFNKLSSSI